MNEAAMLGGLGLFFHIGAILVFGIAIAQWKHCKKRLIAVEAKVAKPDVTMQQLQRFCDHALDVAAEARTQLAKAKVDLAEEHARVARLLHTGLS